MSGEMRYTTDGGTEVFVYPSAGAHSFFISLYVGSGSMHEETGREGINHFLEHIIVRNIDRAMGGRMYETLDEHGLSFNASTSTEMMQFYIGGSPSSFRLSAQLLCRVLSPITLRASEVNAERGRIKAEIREEDEASSLRGFSNAIIWEGTSLATPITGTVGSVNKITLRALEEQRRRIFTRQNVFFSVTGRVGEDDVRFLLDTIEKYELEQGPKGDAVAPVPRNFGKRDAMLMVKGATFTKLQFSFDIDMTRVSQPECYLLYDIVVSADSSRFFVELSEGLGLFYDICGYVDVYKNVGNFSFSYELRESRLYEALEHTVRLLRSYKSELLSESRCMKAGYVDNAEMLLDDPRELNLTMGHEAHILGLGYGSIYDRAEAYSSVTSERLREVAREVFRPENLVLTVKGSKRRIDTSRIKRIIAEL